MCHYRDAAGLGTPAVGPGFIEVQAGADLRTAAGGRVFLFAEDVSNAGRISTPQGQTVLAAGDKVHLQDPTREALYASEVNAAIPALRGLLVEVEGAGRVRHDGVIDTPRGNATVVGLAVNVAGRISATTSVAENGSVLLLARSGASASFNTTGTLVKQATQGGTLTLEPGARVQISPDTTLVNGALPTGSDNAGFTRSRIELAGQTISLGDDTLLQAPGALLRARAGTPDYNADPLTARSAGRSDPGARITIGDGAVIDVAGTPDTTVSVARHSVTTEPLDGVNAAVTSGLEPGDRVATQGATLINQVR